MATTTMSAAALAAYEATREQAADILQVMVVVLAGMIILGVAWEEFKRRKK